MTEIGLLILASVIVWLVWPVPRDKRERYPDPRRNFVRTNPGLGWGESRAEERKWRGEGGLSRLTAAGEVCYHCNVESEKECNCGN